MDIKIKNYVGMALTLTLVVFAYASWSYVGSYAKTIEPGSFRSFTVSGEGEVIGIPDVAQFTYSVIAEGDTDLDALQRSSVEKANAIKEFIRENGVDKKDLKDTQYSVEPRYQYYRCDRHMVEGDGDVAPCPLPEIAGYTIRQTTQVKVRDFETIGTLLSGVVENGANNVSQLSFAIDDPSSLQNEARAKAIEQAKEKAELIADAGNFSVGKLLGINEGSPIPVYQARSYAMLDAAMGGEYAPAPAIEAGSQDITVNVTLTYEIQ